MDSFHRTSRSGFRPTIHDNNKMKMSLPLTPCPSSFIVQVPLLFSCPLRICETICRSARPRTVHRQTEELRYGDPLLLELTPPSFDDDP